MRSRCYSFLSNEVEPAVCFRYHLLMLSFFVLIPPQVLSEESITTLSMKNDTTAKLHFTVRSS